MDNHIIKNYDSLSHSKERKVVLDLIETALHSIEPMQVLSTNVVLHDNTLSIQDKTFDLKQYERIFIVAFGKGSAGIAKIMEEKLGDRLTAGWDIDVVPQEFKKIHFTLGTHPLPSQPNIDFTKQVIEGLGQLTKKDLVLVVICGGGSVMFEMPYKIDLNKLIEVNKGLLKSGATISEMNVIRKHLSQTKGGGFAAKLYPATIASLIFSDVPGNDLTVIASAPTVKDPTTLGEVHKISMRYNLDQYVSLKDEDFHETPKDDSYFANVHNIMLLSNRTALEAMLKKGQELGYKTVIASDSMQGEAKKVGMQLLNMSEPGQITLFGGETTVKVSGTGKGGRNQELVLAALQYLDDKTTIASFDSDGWDFYELCGAIGDKATIQKAKTMGENWQTYLANDDSYTFLTKVGDGILTGKLESNVSDLMIVMRV